MTALSLNGFLSWVDQVAALDWTWKPSRVAPLRPPWAGVGTGFHGGSQAVPPVLPPWWRSRVLPGW